MQQWQTLPQKKTGGDVWKAPFSKMSEAALVAAEQFAALSCSAVPQTEPWSCAVCEPWSFSVPWSGTVPWSETDLSWLFSNATLQKACLNKISSWNSWTTFSSRIPCRFLQTLQTAATISENRWNETSLFLRSLSSPTPEHGPRRCTNQTTRSHRERRHFILEGKVVITTELRELPLGRSPHGG